MIGLVIRIWLNKLSHMAQYSWYGPPVEWIISQKIPATKLIHKILFFYFFFEGVVRINLDLENKQQYNTFKDTITTIWNNRQTIRRGGGGGGEGGIQ